MADSYAFRVTLRQVGPWSDPTFAGQPADVKAALLRAVVAWVLGLKDAELARGLDKDGNTMAALSKRTVEGRHSAMGPADPGAPPLTPAHGLSRTRSLLDGRAMAKRGEAEFFWRSDGHTGASWGRMLGVHRAGNAHLPVRDVIGASPAILAECRTRARAWYHEYRATGRAPDASKWARKTEEPGPRFAVTTVRKYKPEFPEIAAPGANALVSQLGVNGHVYTFGAGANGRASAAGVRRAIAEGTFSGFRAHDHSGPSAAPTFTFKPKPKGPALAPPKPKKPAGATGPAKRPKPVPPVPPPLGEDRVAAGRALAARLDAWEEGDGLVARLAEVGGVTARRARCDVLARETEAAMAAHERAPTPETEAALRSVRVSYSDALLGLKRAEARAREQALEVLAVADPMRLVDGSKSLATLDDPRRTAAEKALSWLGDVVAARPGRDEVAVRYAATRRAADRAYYDAGTITLGDDRPGVVVHEWGHALEDRVPSWGAAARDYLAHRVGAEAPRRLSEVDDAYGADEFGRKDRFDEAFGVNAWYAGKHYDGGATEVTAMALERLYTDPAGLAMADPHLTKFLLAVLRGVPLR